MSSSNGTRSRKYASKSSPSSNGSANSSGGGSNKKYSGLPIHLVILLHTQGIVTSLTTLGVLYTFRTESAYYTIGALSTGFVAKVIKNIIKEPRPDGSRVKKSWGMPSTHSTTVTFMSSYLAFHAMEKIRIAPQWDPMTVIAAAVLIVFPPVVMWSRVALGVHTPKQVIAGGLFGLTSAVAWWSVWLGKVPLGIQHGQGVLSVLPAGGLEQVPLVAALDDFAAAVKGVFWRCLGL